MKKNVQLSLGVQTDFYCLVGGKKFLSKAEPSTIEFGHIAKALFMQKTECERTREFCNSQHGSNLTITRIKLSPVLPATIFLFVVFNGKSFIRQSGKDIAFDKQLSLNCFYSKKQCMALVEECGGEIYHVVPENER